MMDVILSWPRNTDFPIWRQWIRDHRQLFNRVIIVMTETNQGEDYQPFLRFVMARDKITFVDIQPTPPNRDWRDVAVNKGLEYSDAEWVWFTEQDFIGSDELFNEITKVTNHHMGDMVGAYDGKRLHPCCIFINRALLDVTTKNFGIVPDKLDHFGVLQVELERITPVHSPLPPEWYTHMNGLTHNMNLVFNGQEPNYKPEEFKKYLSNCLKVSVPLDERFVKLCTMCLPTSTTARS